MLTQIHWNCSGFFEAFLNTCKNMISDCQIIHFPNVHMNEVVTWQRRLNIWVLSVLSKIEVPKKTIGCSHPYVQPSIIWEYRLASFVVLLSLIPTIQPIHISYICIHIYWFRHITDLLTHLYLLPSIWKLWVMLPNYRNCFFQLATTQNRVQGCPVEPPMLTLST